MRTSRLLALLPAIALCFVATQAYGATVSGFDIRMLKIHNNAGIGDNDINDNVEARRLLNNVNGGDRYDNLGGSGLTYLVDIDHHSISQTVNFDGGNNFGGDSLWPANPDAGDDFTVQATANVFIPQGTWNINFGSDDGGQITIPGVSFTATNGENGNNGVGTDTIIFNAPRGHGQTGGTFTVGAGGLNTTIDASMFERGGGDSFELSVGAGGATCCGTHQLLQDGTLGWSVKTDDSNINRAFNTTVIQVGDGGADTQVNNTTEARLLANTVFGTGIVGNHQITLFEQSNTETVIDFAGGGGNFNINADYPDNGAGGNPGNSEDFVVTANTFVKFAPGTYTIAIGSDDGRFLSLDGILFDSAGDQTNIGGAGTDNIGFENPTGHNQSVGTFTIDNETISELFALMWERGGGDSFEISIADGVFSDFNDNDFVLLVDGALQGRIQLDTDLRRLNPVPEPTTAILGLMGLAGMGLRRRRQAA